MGFPGVRIDCLMCSFLEGSTFSSPLFEASLTVQSGVDTEKGHSVQEGAQEYTLCWICLCLPLGPDGVKGVCTERTWLSPEHLLILGRWMGCVPS